MAISVIKVRGLKELNRNLREVDRDLPNVLRAAGNQAAQIVVRDAKGRVPRRSGRAAGSVKASSTRTAARVQGGGKRVPYYPWLDFGGHVGRNNSVSRPFLKEGRYIWKSFADHREEVRDAMEEELRRAVGSRMRVY